MQIEPAVAWWFRFFVIPEQVQKSCGQPDGSTSQASRRLDISNWIRLNEIFYQPIKY